MQYFWKWYRNEKRYQVEGEEADPSNILLMLP
jgi:hypothetical protein